MTPTVAIMLRLDSVDIPERFAQGLIGYTLGALIIRLFIFHRFQLYRRYWRFASIDDLIQISVAITTATLLIAVLFIIIRWIYFIVFPRSVIIIDGILTLILVGGVRFSIRAVDQLSRRASGGVRRGVLVMGAGEAGAMVVRELQRNPQLNQTPVGYLDDDSSKHGMKIHGVPVLGGREDIPRVVQAHRIKRIIIAIPTSPGKVIREIVRLCEEVGVDTKTIPGVYELLDDTVNINQIRDVDIEDLLRREPVQTDFASVIEMLSGKNVLVTGGGGSVGRELCRQILRCNPKQLVILGHGENSIYEIYEELTHRHAERDKLIPIIADTRFAYRIEGILRQTKPEIIFHAAAHKHVPLMEVNPAEAITNNILGTKCLLEAAQMTNVNRFIFISTDKAVNPTSVMGASKRVAELLVLQTARETSRPFVAVRFGNVLGSRGSVVLTFKKQIAAGGPVTVTHPEVKRYFMTIPEAVQLVLQASVIGRGGDLLMLDMGEPINILDMAKDLIVLSGFEVERDLEIEFTGLRPGEKLTEELFIPGEKYEQTEHEKIFVVESDKNGLPKDFNTLLEDLELAANRDDIKAIIDGLKKLVPEFYPTTIPFTD
jgi:FlaA1/EpsC-like NDP-sugar epimerase